MRLKIKQPVLMEHLNYVIKGISNKNLIPILNCIKFDLTNDGLYLMSTDNEIAIKTFISKKDIESIDTCGKIVVSGRFIYEIIRKLPNEIINIEEVVDSKLSITTTSSSFQLNCNNVNDFPDLDLEDNKTPIILDQKLFKTIINQTIFATSNQESRPILTGINFHIEKDNLLCIATDSYRLAKKKITIKNPMEEVVDIVIPTKNISELLKLLNSDDEDIELHIFSNKIIFKFNDIVMMSRLINGTYPDTSKLIPNTFDMELKANLSNFYDAIDRASLLTNEADKNTIRLESNGNEITVSSNIPEIGNVEDKVIVENIKNRDIKIAFSSKYMMDALKAFGSSEVELLFNGEIKPIILKNPESDDLVQLILPIRTY